MISEVVHGTGISSWEARIVVDTIHDVYFREPGTAPLQSGQLRYECLRADQPAGRPLAQCRQTSVVLTLLDSDDAKVNGAEALRRHRLARLAEQAREQGGLLTQEDLAQLLACDVRTIRRDIQRLKTDSGVVVPTRGQQKDIGPTVTHKGVAVRHWLDGKEPQEVARAINHSLHAVERYLQHFSRVVFLAGLGFSALQIAFTIGISSATVKTYLDLYGQFKTSEGFKARLAELKAIGQAHYQGGDDKKGALSPRNASSI
jgi:DNA-directed RNA polymerase specialized sigma24 family protein